MTLSTEFTSQILQLLPQVEAEKLFHAIENTEPSVAIRLNAAKCNPADAAQVPGERVPWCRRGFYLSERQPFTFDPLLHAGAYYVQDASSMILQHIVEQLVTGPVRYLDLCAAPGGKTTAAIDALPHGSLMVTNEIMPDRARVLLENVVKWGNPHCVVTSDSSDRIGTLTHFFDVIAADVPCSGEGMFRKDAEAMAQWSPRLVEQCAERQREIIDNIWQALRPGGIFIYSTCTYNPLEDEENVEWIAKTLGADVLSCHPLPEWGLTETNTHFYPHRVKGEGFFVSVLRKTTTDDRQQPTGNGRHKKLKEGKKGKVTPKIPQELKRWLLENEDFGILEEGDLFRAIPIQHHALYDQVQRNLKVVHAGIELASNLRAGRISPAKSSSLNSLRPSQSLAMSNSLNKEVFPIAEVDEQQAIAYLRTEALQLPANTPKGYVLITYQGHPLGFAKNIGNRANNLYPAEWRIRKSEK